MSRAASGTGLHRRPRPTTPSPPVRVVEPATTVDDTVMAIYTGACGSLTEIPTADATDGCDDDACADEGLQSVIRTQLNGGATYFIVGSEFDPTPPTAGHTAAQL